MVACHLSYGITYSIKDYWNKAIGSVLHPIIPASYPYHWDDMNDIIMFMKVKQLNFYGG